MTSRLCLALVLLLTVACGPSQHTDQELAASARAQADELAQCFVTKDFRKLAQRTLPMVVEGMGGADKMVARMEAGTKNGPDVTGVEVGTATAHRRGKTVFAIVPFAMKFQASALMPERQDSFLIGVTHDDGAAWHFVDGATMTRDKLARVLPEFPADVELPKAR